jgi:hypothetical protein
MSNFKELCDVVRDIVERLKTKIYQVYATSPAPQKRSEAESARTVELEVVVEGLRAQLEE